MAAVVTSVCSGPLDLVCQVTDAVQSAASDYVVGGLGSAFVGGSAQAGQLALTALDTTTAIDLGASWFRANVAVIASIALPAVVGLFVIQVLTSVLRREPGGLARGVVGVGKALLGAALALAVTQVALTLVDALCQYIAGSAGYTVGSAAARFFRFSFLTGLSPALQLLLGLLLMVGFVLLWGVLLFRKAALILVAVFAPIAFAGSAWDQTRVWTRRWLEIVAALVFCKVVIVVTFVVGASAFSGTGPAVGSVPAGGDSTGLSDLLVGVLLLAIAIWAPWLTWRFVHWSGMEAATVMHANVAANPISKVGQSAVTTTKFAAQHVALTAVTGGAGAGAAPARGAAAAAGAASAVRPPGQPPAAPRPLSGGEGR
ncbi:type IV secretion system protein [Cellulomonas sp. NTE-D12]|uniref:type IV secretion system protein n=1 Tax=Cellulomonas sp. NTE-D12 TaxID=2962632 RepID=UPI0030813BE8|nr:hypothetical protein CELD12_15650 [Cellulomonas sp. NTE-D12]